jgi:hypothetical protein
MGCLRKFLVVGQKNPGIFLELLWSSPPLLLKGKATHMPILKSVNLVKEDVDGQFATQRIKNRGINSHLFKTNINLFFI